jgi:Ser/Thr protein kinase RdoA (MazF antagonist)
MGKKIITGESMNFTRKAAEQFSPTGKVVEIREHGNGNINDTYLVSVDSGHEHQFILQRINTYVFKHPELIIRNLHTYTKHIEAKIAVRAENQDRRWDIPQICATRDSRDFYVDPENRFWRALSFINHSSSFETVQSIHHAREAGYAMGKFHNLVCDLNPNRMHDTLVGFHITPHYLRLYDDVMARGPQGSDGPLVRYCHRMIADRRDWATVLEDAKAAGLLPIRTIHGDPKINNIMISDETGQAVSFIDLDTVKPGLVHYDIGDCLRSSCNPLGEDTLDFDNVHFETDLARAILEGYISVANEFLTENDYAYFYDAIRLLAFELGIRFFQDYLAGNIYYKTRYDNHNLDRAIVQFKLTESIEAQAGSIRQIIQDMRPVVA